MSPWVCKTLWANVVPIPVVPIPKETNKFDVQFYRPISLLPIISKTLERHVYSLLSEHLAAHNILSANQFGFQHGRNTTTPS